MSRRLFETATDGATVIFDFAKSKHWKVTLAGNRTIAFANLEKGQRYMLAITQDGTGSRTLTWPSGTLNSPTLTTTAGKSDVFELISDGTNHILSTYVANITLA